MKKNLFVIALIFLFAGCDKPGDCVKSTGAMTSKTYDSLTFSKIIVHKGISVVITQGSDYKVEVQTGENLINDIEVNVVDGMLTLEDNTTCNWVRDYGQTVVYVTTPNLTDVYCKTEGSITSNGTLTFPNLHIVSMDSVDGYSGAGTGDYHLQLDNTSLFVENNNVSNYYITGNTDNLTVHFYESGGIFHGEDLIANAVSLYHRGSNDLYLHPLQSIVGDIYNIGNVYSVVHPPVVNVTAHYHGRLIFE